MMRKQWIAMLLTFLMLLSGCGGGTEPSGNEAPVPPVTEKEDSTSQPSDSQQPNSEIQEKVEPPVPDDTVLESLREETADIGALFAVGYLGYAELPGWEDVAVYVEANGFGEKLPFLLNVMEDHAVLQEGGQVYAVVPVSSDVTLTISEYLMQDMPVRGKDLLTVSDGKPVLLRGNVSEIVSNLLITAQTSDGRAVEYNPCLSGMDGRLVSESGVYDFSPYSLLKEMHFGYDPFSYPAFVGTWYAQHHDGDLNLMAMTLELAPDGYAEYRYGEPYSAVYERFAGTWSLGGRGDEIGELWLTLNMTGGVIGEGAVVEQPYEMTNTFTWDIQGSSLVLRHEGGSPLLYATEGDWYNFMPFNGFHLRNTWTSVAEYQNWYYDLQLFENCECRFAIRDINGGELVSYEGWWYLEESMLRLDMMRNSGHHPENPELDYIYGGYLAESREPGDLTLSYLYGDILTVEMEESGYASFFGD